MKQACVHHYDVPAPDTVHGSPTTVGVCRHCGAQSGPRRNGWIADDPEALRRSEADEKGRAARTERGDKRKRPLLLTPRTADRY